ncbi:MAG TPA: hypothetical protein VFP72_09185 [Kineosporiaceae bacterium]|nr:hypothetical protein [Kineosporiaceae bacterium]
MAKGRWFGRGGDAPAGTSLDPTQLAQLRSHHLLLVPSTVGVEEVSDLVSARVMYGDLARDGEVPLGRHSRLVGPFELNMEEAVDAGVPMPWTVVYALDAPVEREDPPLPGLDDRDGFAFAFPRGLPWREEGRGLHLIVAMARRLHGAVRVSGSELIQPDPDRAVDFAVRSPYWLDPDTLKGVVSRELPNAELALDGVEWSGPSPELYSGLPYAQDIAHDPLRADELAWLHQRADAYDLDVLAGEDSVDAYAVVGQIGNGRAGAIEVRVHVAPAPEPAVVREAWADGPYVVYEVRWACPDLVQRERRVPLPEFAAMRRHAAEEVLAVTRSVVEAVSGVVTDEDGFWVDRYFL